MVALAALFLLQTPDDLNNLRLTGPVSIEYTVDEGTKLTASEIDAIASAEAKRQEDVLRKHNVPEADIKQALEGVQQMYGSYKAGRKLHITFATDGEKYLFMQEPADKKPDPIEGDNSGRWRILYDGKRTYFFYMNGHQITVRDGQQGAELDHLLLPGIGLLQFSPARPLQKEADYPITEGFIRCEVITPRRVANVKDSPFSFRAGSALAKMVDGQIQIQRMVIGRPETRTEEWTFGDPFKFGGKWVARSSTYSFYSLQNKDKPLLETDFHLSKISATAPHKDAFDLKKYIAANEVLVMDQRAGQNAIAFYFDPKLSLDEQLEKHKNDTPGVIHHDGG